MRCSACTTVLLSILFCAIAGTPSCAEETVSSRITGATLFTNQALVKREATAEVDKGVVELLLEVEAFRVEADSVTAKVFGEGEVYSVQYKEIYLEEAPQENIRVLEEKKEELQNQRVLLQADLEIVGKKAEFLDSLIQFSRVQLPKDVQTAFPQTEELEKTLFFLDKNMKELAQKKHELMLQTREIDEEIELINKELTSLRQTVSHAKKGVSVLFNSQKPQTISIEASYLVSGASWQPFYKVDVPLDLKEMNLTMFAKIYQKTGEDWDDIGLSISNVVPLKGAAIPYLSSWILDVPRPLMRKPEAKCLFALGGARDGAVEEQLPRSKADKEEGEANFIQADRKELPLSFEYTMPHAFQLESRDKETVLPLFSRGISGNYVYYAVPRINPYCFLLSRVTADKELLGGLLNVYFGGRYIGKVYLQEKKAGDEFRLNLGVDRDIKVKRETIKDQVNETFFGKIQRQTVVRDFAYKITVENLKSKPITIQVVDNVPVSRTDKIEVKNVTITPKPKEERYQDQEGVLLWEFTLAPGQQQVIDVAVTVLYPQDEKPVGL
ncbi:MAG: DUF4139 domain-containing protein [Candidatus Omnitrophica bacterium]|nr:DUF4139 domain-containing protein [Candidatus Omnitrophota bacterium]